MIVHDREAHQETMQILKEEQAEVVVLHCFSGDVAMAEEAWDRGYYTSIAGPVTYPKNEALREVVRRARPASTSTAIVHRVPRNSKLFAARSISPMSGGCR